MSIQTVVLRSLGDLIDRLTPDKPDKATGRRRDTGVYRGSADATWPLLTSLDRLGGSDPPHTKGELEAHILRNFRRYSRPFLEAPLASDWELLVTAQHHGVPTRFLDWTYSPLVAAHFATRKAAPAGRDRAIWRLEWQQVHRRFELPELSLLLEDLERHLGRGGAFTPWALFERKPDATPFACMIEPPTLTARIGTQSAVFTLCSDRTRSFDRFLDEHGLGGALTRFVIPADEAQRFRDQLDLAGMDERRLFPDLDAVAEDLRRYYS